MSQELKVLGILPRIAEQVPLFGRVKIDLLVGRVAIEIKALGSFGDDAKKYSGYRTKVEQKGWINVDFPVWMTQLLDKEARRLGVPRQSIIKVWVAERLEKVS